MRNDIKIPHPLRYSRESENPEQTFRRLLDSRFRGNDRERNENGGISVCFAASLHPIIRTKFFCLTVALLLFSLLRIIQPPPIFAANGGKILCTVTIPDSQGEITLSLFSLLGEKLFEKKVILPKESGKPFPLVGTTSNNVYILEAEGQISSTSDPNTTQPYSKACKVTTDNKGNAKIEFGN